MRTEESAARADTETWCKDGKIGWVALMATPGSGTCVWVSGLCFS
jgi:hypothetical protein